MLHARQVVHKSKRLITPSKHDQQWVKLQAEIEQLGSAKPGIGARQAFFADLNRRSLRLPSAADRKEWSRGAIAHHGRLWRELPGVAQAAYMAEAKQANLDKAEQTRLQRAHLQTRLSLQRADQERRETGVVNHLGSRKFSDADIRIMCQEMGETLKDRNLLACLREAALQTLAPSAD